MSEKPIGNVTEHLRAVANGGSGAADALMRLVYGELKQLAQSRLKGRWGRGAPDPTVLVHEAYMRLFGREPATWENRHHFFWAASRAMRDILVEHARHHAAKKRGGGLAQADLDLENAAASESADYLALDEAIEKFRALYPEAARVVMLRFYSGLTREETADVLGISPATQRRELRGDESWDSGWSLLFLVRPLVGVFRP